MDVTFPRMADCQQLIKANKCREGDIHSHLTAVCELVWNQDLNTCEWSKDILCALQ